MSPDSLPANSVPTRMRFWPSDRRSQVALLLIMFLCLLKGVLMASTIPPWWAPDEDYHFGYTNYIAERGSLPNPQKPFYPPEYSIALEEMNYNQFGTSPAGPTALTGDPHAVGSKLWRENGEAERQPTGEPTRPVMHAPLYHLVAAAFFKPFAGKAVFTRVWIGRIVNSLVAMLIVFAAWVLAAQVFSRAGPRLFVAALAGLQPMVVFATGTMTNDAVIIAFFTLSVAVMLFMLKNPPDRRHSLLLGLFIALALLSKSSALLLVPIAVAVVFWQWFSLTSKPRSKALFAKSLGFVALVPAVLAGWFYLYLIFKYHSLTGALGAINAPTFDASGAQVHRSLTELPGITRQWLQDTYSTYWTHFIFWEGPRDSVWFYVPLFFGLTGMLGFAIWVIDRIRAHRWRGDKVFAQVVLLTAVALLIVFPWWAADMQRGLAGNGFAFNGGRFMLGAFPAAAVLFTIGLCTLLRRRVQLIVLAVVALVTMGLSVEMWKIKTLDRYYGGEGVASIHQELERASFFHPSVITAGSLTALIALIGVVFIAAWAAGIYAAVGDVRKD